MSYRHILAGIIVSAFCFTLYYLQNHFYVKLIRSSDDAFQPNTSIHHYAILLARKPSIKVLKHLNALVHAGVNAYVMCDEQPSKYINLTARVLYIDDRTLGFYGLFRNRVWDRAFVWLYNQSSIDYVWLIEDDVIWSNIRHIVHLFNKYASSRADLLSRNVIYRNNQTLG